MSLIFVPQGTSAPGELIFDDTQIQWDGLLMGRDTYFGYKSLIGWDDLPAVDSADAARPHHAGDFAGAMYPQGRIISLDTQIWGVNKDDGSFAQLRQEFLRRFQVTQEEQPLTIQQHGETMMCFARVIARSWPIDRKYFNGYPVASVQWKATDPRKYSTTEQSTTLLVPVSVGGLDYTTGGGLDYTTGGGLDYGTIQSGTGVINNSGLADTPVRVEFVGPLTSPYYINTEDGSWTLGFTLPLAPGETLVADARLGTVTLGGVDRYYALALQSDLPEDCLAPPGATPVQFAPGSPSDTGHVDIFWRNAQM
jgi:hypothetical protein